MPDFEPPGVGTFGTYKRPTTSLMRAWAARGGTPVQPALDAPRTQGAPGAPALDSEARVAADPGVSTNGAAALFAQPVDQEAVDAMLARLNQSLADAPQPLADGLNAPQKAAPISPNGLEGLATPAQGPEPAAPVWPFQRPVNRLQVAPAGDAGGLADAASPSATVEDATPAAARPLPQRPRQMGDNSMLDAARAQALAARNLRRMQDALRPLMRERMRPENCHILPDELARPTDKVRAAARVIALQTVSDWREAELRQGGALSSVSEASALAQYLLDTQFGEGALQPLFDDASVEEIILNSEREDGDVVVRVFAIKAGKKELTDIIISPDEVVEIANRHGAHQGRALNTSNPILNTRMTNGARLNAVLDPACTPHVSMTIRVHRLVARSFDDLLALGSLTLGAANFIYACVHSGVSILVAGGTASGKTNLLNAVARIMPAHLRCIVIEDTPELDLAVPDKVYLTAVNGRVTQRELVATSLRMRPDRIVVGEVRDGAAWDAIKATNTGHPGTLLTIHAENAHSVPLRMLQLCAEAPETQNMSERRLLETIAQAFSIIVFIERDSLVGSGARRRITQIVQMPGHVADGKAQLVDLFAMQDEVLERTPARPSAELIRQFARSGFAEDALYDAMEGKVKLWT